MVRFCHERDPLLCKCLSGHPTCCHHPFWWIRTPVFEHVATALEDDPDSLDSPRGIRQGDFVPARRRQVFVWLWSNRRLKHNTLRSDGGLTLSIRGSGHRRRRDCARLGGHRRPQEQRGNGTSLQPARQRFHFPPSRLALRRTSRRYGGSHRVGGANLRCGEFARWLANRSSLTFQAVQGRRRGWDSHPPPRDSQLRAFRTRTAPASGRTAAPDSWWPRRSPSCAGAIARRSGYRRHRTAGWSASRDCSGGPG
jgi:hypothetical protein